LFPIVPGLAGFSLFQVAPAKVEILKAKFGTKPEALPSKV
jgi:hypothetical protein